jgi:NADH-quinone oxidoreductase subunit N
LKVPVEYTIVAVVAISLNIILGIFPSVIMGLEL